MAPSEPPPYAEPDPDDLESLPEGYVDAYLDGEGDHGFDPEHLDPVLRARLGFGVVEYDEPKLPVPRLPTATTKRAPYRRWVQVNIRLTDDGHRDLARAAEILELKPTQLARLLVRNGTTQVLDEQRLRDR